MYIGKPPTVGNFQACDAISVVNGQAAYTLQVGGTDVAPESAQHCLVSLNGVLQAPISSYTISGSTLTFAANLATGDSIDFITILGDVLDIGAPSDDTVTAAKLNNDIISGTTALTSAPDDTDEFLVSDAGTLKRIDYSLIKGGGITMADQWRITSSATFDSTESDITANLEQVDTTGQGTLGSAMTQSSGIFTFPSTGIYLVSAHIAAYRSGETRYAIVFIKGTTDNSSYSDFAQGYDSIKQADSGATYCNPITSTLVDVTNTSNVKVKFALQAVNEATLSTGTSTNRCFFTFLRLGDT